MNSPAPMTCELFTVDNWNFKESVADDPNVKGWESGEFVLTFDGRKYHASLLIENADSNVINAKADEIIKNISDGIDITVEDAKQSGAAFSRGKIEDLGSYTLDVFDSYVE